MRQTNYQLERLALNFSSCAIRDIPWMPETFLAQFLVPVFSIVFLGFAARGVGLWRARKTNLCCPGKASDRVLHVNKIRLLHTHASILSIAQIFAELSEKKPNHVKFLVQKLVVIIEIYLSLTKD